jgi:nicotinamidase-related amidase
MPLAEGLVDRDDMVLVIVDVQERLVAAMADRDTVVATIGRLARVTWLVGAPIVMTRQYPKGLGPFVEELERLLMQLAYDGAHVHGVDKTAFCCAADAEFERALKATGRTQVVLCGMETHICIAQTALELASSGYRVQVVADACCSRTRADHEVALARLRAAGVVVTSAEAVQYEAVGAAGTDEFKRLLEIVKG